MSMGTMPVSFFGSLLTDHNELERRLTGMEGREVRPILP